MSAALIDLSQFSDELIFEAVSQERPEFISTLRGAISAGLSDQQIMRLAYLAKGSGRALTYTRICLAVMRRERFMRRHEVADE